MSLFKSVKPSFAFLYIYFFFILYFFFISCTFFIHVSAIYQEQKYVNICVNYSNFSIITFNSLDAFSFAN